MFLLVCLLALLVSQPVAAQWGYGGYPSMYGGYGMMGGYPGGMMGGYPGMMGGYGGYPMMGGYGMYGGGVQGMLRGALLGAALGAMGKKNIMFLVVLLCSLSAVFGQAVFSIGLTAGDANGGQGYQPLVPQPATYIQPYQTGVVPVASYPSYPIEAGYPTSSYGVGYPMQMAYGGYPYSGYPQIYEINRPEGPMRRFWKGAADGVVQGSLGWLG